MSKNSKHTLPFLVSATSKSQLQAKIRKWLEYICKQKFHTTMIRDLCATSMLHTRHHNFRISTLVSKKSELIAYLENSHNEISQCGTSVELVLCLGSLREEDIQAVMECFSKDQDFLHHANQVKKLLPKKQKTLRQGVSSLVLEFAALYALAKRLELCVTPDMVTGEYVGLLVSAAVAQIIDLPTAIKLLERNSPQGIKLHRPTMGYFDPMYKTVLEMPQSDHLANWQQQKLTGISKYLSKAKKATIICQIGKCKHLQRTKNYPIVDLLANKDLRENISQCLLQLWKAGMAPRWQQWFTIEKYQKLELPGDIYQSLPAHQHTSVAQSQELLYIPE